MADRNEDIRKLLHREDEEFRTWAEQHHRYEDRLSELADKTMLSPDEEVEERELKKKKLYLKDQMAARIRGYEAARV